MVVMPRGPNGNRSKPEKSLSDMIAQLYCFLGNTECTSKTFFASENNVLDSHTTPTNGKAAISYY